MAYNKGDGSPQARRARRGAGGTGAGRAGSDRPAGGSGPESRPADLVRLLSRAARLREDASHPLRRALRLRQAGDDVDRRRREGGDPGDRPPRPPAAADSTPDRPPAGRRLLRHERPGDRASTSPTSSRRTATRSSRSRATRSRPSTSAARSRGCSTRCSSTAAGATSCSSTGTACSSSRAAATGPSRCPRWRVDDRAAAVELRAHRGRRLRPEGAQGRPDADARRRLRRCAHGRQHRPDRLLGAGAAGAAVRDAERRDRPALAAASTHNALRSSPRRASRSGCPPTGSRKRVPAATPARLRAATSAGRSASRGSGC